MSSTILAIDDSPEILISIGAILEEAYDVRVATSGEQGLEMAENLLPDLILLDIMMPGVDGFETCRRLQQNDNLRGIPVIFLTSLDRPEDEAFSFEAGASDFVSKPFNPVVLKARIMTQLRLKEQAHALRNQAIHDALTHLFNRRHFDERLEQEWLAGQRDGHPLALLLIDIDYFKKYNDGYGHPQGDRCLQFVAESIRAALHRARDLAARYGGEEFVCLLPNTDCQGATEVAEQIRSAIEDQRIAHVGSEVADVVTISVGVACEEGFEGSSAAALVERADRNLYRAKSLGRNRVARDAS